MSLSVKSKRMAPFRILSILVILLVAACSSPTKRKLLTPSDAALHYAQLLKEERYEEYMDAMCSLDSASQGQREQMKTLLRQHVRQMKEERGELYSIRVSKEQSMTPQMSVVFLMLTFSDSTKEETVLHLYREKGQWRLY